MEPSLNQVYKVNVKRERFLMIPFSKGINLFDKDTRQMIYNPVRLDGLYDSWEATLKAASEIAKC